MTFIPNDSKIASKSDDDEIGTSPATILLNVKSKQKQEFEAQFKSRWKSIRVHYFTLFINAVASTIVYSSLWTYLKMMDVETTTWYLGIVHACFNAAELCCIILFGAWVQYRPSFEPLTFSLVCLIIGNALYSWALSFGYYGKFAVLIARLLVGCATGNDVVVTAVVCEQTTIKERTRVIAYCSLAQAVGFTIGPAIQACFVPLGQTGVFFPAIHLHINMYTMAGLAGVLFGAANLIAIWATGKSEFRIENPYIDTETEDCASENPDDESDSLLKTEKKAKKKKDRLENIPDVVAIAVTLIVFFIARHVLVFLEVMFSPIAMDQYALSDSDNVLYVGLILAFTGFFSTFIFVATEKIASLIGDRIPLIISSLLMVLAFLFLWPLSNRYPKLGHFYTEMVNTTTGIEYIKRVTPGCSPTHSWCTTTPIVTLAQFFICIVLITIAFPISYSILPSLFSKIIPPGRQGIMVSLFSISGNLSRIFGPAAFTTLYSYYGPKILFALMDIGLTCSFILTIAFYKRLIPYKVYLRKKKRDCVMK